jgi:outer membrane protein TolC
MVVTAFQAVLAVVLAAAGTGGGDAVSAPSGPSLLDDPVLRSLVKEAMERRPELVQARAEIRAQQERVPQSRVLPDPMLAVGIQNDGFSSIQIGKMETSFVSIMASQTFPWSGKRGARGELAGLGAREAELDLRRVLLSLAADIERAYLDVLLVRDQLGLLTRLESLWAQSEAVTRVRYESGEAAQSDLLRAQLERNRLRQRRWSLLAEERSRVALLNRLRGHAPGDAIATTRTLTDLPDPPQVLDPQQALAEAQAESPELKKALLAGESADRRVDLAKRDRWPDVTVSAAIMPRGGNFVTMWQAGVAVNLPVWAAQKQTRAIAENQARGEAARSGAEALRQLLGQRVSERLAALEALLESNRLYRSGLLVQSEATVKSTLAQYQVGRVTFASVLEALGGYLGDMNGFLESVVAAQRIAVAQREISLDPPEGPAAGGMGAPAMPGAGATATAATAKRAGSSAASGAQGSASAGAPM